MTTKAMPPCKIELGANEEGVGTITYIWEGHTPMKITPYRGQWPQPEDVKELWLVAKESGEYGPLTLVVPEQAEREIPSAKVVQLFRKGD